MYGKYQHTLDAKGRLFVPSKLKEELGAAVGRTACAMLAITDVGFAEAVAKKLAAANPEKYAQSAEKLHVKAERAAQRRKERQAHERNVRHGGKKPAGPKK